LWDFHNDILCILNVISRLKSIPKLSHRKTPWESWRAVYQAELLVRDRSTAPRNSCRAVSYRGPRWSMVHMGWDGLSAAQNTPPPPPQLASSGQLALRSTDAVVLLWWVWIWVGEMGQESESYLGSFLNKADALHWELLFLGHRALNVLIELHFVRN
jgi:hypothetical protein